MPDEMKEIILDSFSWLKETGLEMAKRYRLEHNYASKESIEQLKKDILFSPNDKPLNEAVKKYWDYLSKNYQLDRLQWIVQFSELYFDIGGLPTGYNSWWCLYWTMLGREPKNIYLPEGTNWYWLVRRYYRFYDKKYVRNICKKFFIKYPNTKEDMLNLHIPKEFIEISKEVDPNELYQYWKNNYGYKLFKGKNIF